MLAIQIPLYTALEIFIKFFSKILAGKTSGVTITPAQPRVLPSGSTNLGYGISISRTTLGAKSSSPNLASLPSGITISSLGSGFSPRPGGGLGYSSVQAHTSVTPPPAKAEKVKMSKLNRNVKKSCAQSKFSV